MNCKVDYALYTDNMQSEYAKDIKAFYIPNKYLKFNNNEIDLENERFRRTTEDYELIIDFKTKMCILNFDNLDAGKFSIESFYKSSDNNLVLEYALGEEIKKIIVTIRKDRQ